MFFIRLQNLFFTFTDDYRSKASRLKQFFLNQQFNSRQNNVHTMIKQYMLKGDKPWLKLKLLDILRPLYLLFLESQRPCNDIYFTNFRFYRVVLFVSRFFTATYQLYRNSVPHQ
jgi:hypothetical protein